MIDAERLLRTQEHGRAAALIRMTSRATVRREDGLSLPNAEGIEVPNWAIVHANLPARLKGKGGRVVKIGDVEFQQADGELHLPYDTYDLADDDLIELTSGEWAGSVWRVTEAVMGDQRTARRIPVTQASRPIEWG